MKHRVPLDGLWQFVADLDPEYHGPTYYSKYAGLDVERTHWLRVPVPGVWQKYAERYDLFEGVGWFARWFEAPPCAEGSGARLRFGAVNYACDVFLNGQPVGAHEGGYTPFTLDVSAALRPGRNLLAVRVDNRRHRIVFPAVMGYFNYGGIHRPVALEVLEGPCLDDVWVRAEPSAGDGLLTVSGAAAQSGDGLSVRIGCNGAEASGSVEGGRFELTLDVPGAEPWMPEAPVLYEVSVRLERDGDSLDEETHQTGFRRIEQRDGRVLLNGVQVRLRGICHVYDSPATGLTLTGAQVAEDIALLREAGANTVRCHWPMDPRFYAACDRAGIMVWTEVPVYCVHVPSEERGSVFADPHALSLAIQVAEEMVAGARNHPSVVLYGAGNECTVDHPEAPAFFEQLCGRIRKLDATRLLSYAALYGNVGPLADWVDVLGINSYWGWYDKVFPLPNGQNCPGASEAPALEPIDLSGMRNMLEGVLAGRSGLALLLTEFGADSVAGYRSRARDLWSEDYHAALYDAIFALAAEYPQIVGTFPFVLSDYRDPSKLPNAYWNELNLKGIVTYYRERKLAFDALRRAYTA